MESPAIKKGAGFFWKRKAGRGGVTVKNGLKSKLLKSKDGFKASRPDGLMLRPAVHFYLFFTIKKIPIIAIIKIKGANLTNSHSNA